MDQSWDIIYYETSKGKSPIEEFVNSLESKAKSKIVNSLDLLAEFGVKLGQPHVKKINGTDLWELRILGGDNVRIFYVAVSGRKFLLLHGFVKKTQKTEVKEIKVAVDRLKEFNARGDR